MPTALATCCVTLSSVEPRATSAALSVLSAEVNSGIIVAPMPSPVTNSQPMMCQSDVPGSVLWARPNMPIRMPRKPNGTMRPTGILSTQRAGDRHRQHRADALGAISRPAFLTE